MKLNKVKVGVKGIILLLLFMNFSCSSNDDIPSVVATTPTLEIPLPTLTNISPTSGPKTTIVTIYGDDFGNINNTQVFFNEIEAVVQTVTKTEITAIVPIRAFTGLVKVISNSTELIGPEFTYLISDIQVSTLAGSDQGYLDGTGVNAQFDFPLSVAVDTQGNVYVVDNGNHRVRKITPNGVVSTLAGNDEGFADGTGANAQFNGPRRLAVDSQDNIYVADLGNFKIRKISPDGVVSTLAGSDRGFADGIGSEAKFESLYGITVDSQGNVYVADSSNLRLIRKITPTGVVTTLAGSTTGFTDGIGADAQFNRPRGITVDSQGNLYVADQHNHRIRKVSSSGVVTTLAGSAFGFADGLGVNAQFGFPNGVAVDIQNNIYVADLNNHKIRKITQE